MDTAHTKSHAQVVDRVAWWLRSDMGLRDATDPPVPGPLKARGRCDLHATGHARSAFTARLTGVVLAAASMVALMLGARPASADTPTTGQPVATAVGAGLGALGVAGFVAGRAIERRTRFHVWLQCESRALTQSDVLGLVDAVDEVRGRTDRTWSPDQTWIVGAGVTADVASLARTHGVRCFVRDAGKTREV